MELDCSYVDIDAPGGPMRTFVAAPAREGKFPAIGFYTDIFQLTDSSLRWAKRLASYGFIVAAPEIYYRIEAPGSVLAFDDAGKERGQADVDQLYAAQFDEDIAALVTYLQKLPNSSGTKLGIAGHCTGGHIAFRAALSADVAATACWYPTGLHNGKLGADGDSGSLALANQIPGELLMIFGSRDPHSPEPERESVHRALEAADVKFTWTLYDAEHAFARDIGPRWNPQATDQAMTQTVDFFKRILEN